MSSNKDFLIVVKKGIVPFIVNVVKEHQRKLIRETPGHKAAEIIYTRNPLCHTCCFDTLQKLQKIHQKSLHEEKKSILKIAGPLEETLCPNSICDYIFIGILRDHYNHTPNISNTKISEWTQDAWQIALCYMPNKSRSVKDASLLDLLHLMANNKFILAKLHIVLKLPEEQILNIRKARDRLEECLRMTKQMVTHFEEVPTYEIIQITSSLNLINDENSQAAHLKIVQMIARILVRSELIKERDKERNAGLNIKSYSKQELTIKEFHADYSDNTGEEGNVHDCLSTIKEKLGDNSFMRLILEGIQLEDTSNEVKHPEYLPLETITLVNCNFTPIFKESIKHIEITRDALSPRTLTDYLSEVTHQAFLSCPNFKTIKTNDITVGRKKIRICLERSVLQDISLEYFKVSPRGCDRKLATELVKIAVQNCFAYEKCNAEDFKNACESEMKTIILRSICFNLKKSDKNFIDVYPAKYRTSRLNDQEIVLVCFFSENFDISMERSWGEYEGFKTYSRSYDLVLPESEIVENSHDLNDEDEYKRKEISLRNIGIVINYHTRRLFEQHSNLEAISVSMGKANKDRLDITLGPCIVVYVRLKSFIPYEESEFENHLASPTLPNMKYRVDVREGYYRPLADFRPDTDEKYPFVPTKTLLMGSSIGIEGNEVTSATLGPFVEWVEQENIKKCGFLTVCHAFSLPTKTSVASGLKVVQPANVDQFHKISNSKNVNNVCGIVMAFKYQDDIDAAIVEITARVPTSTSDSFIDCRESDYAYAGFDHKPEYKDGSSDQPELCISKKVVKFGNVSFLTVGRCETDKAVVSFRNFDIDTTCPHTGDKMGHVLKNQFTVRETKQGGDGFCKLGDSGSGVFVINEDKSLSCIGMLVGRISDGTAVVTPIQRIIDRFAGQLSQLKLMDFKRDDPQ